MADCSKAAVFPVCTIPTLVKYMRAVDTHCSRLQAAQGEVWCVGIGEKLQDHFTYDTATGYPMFTVSQGISPACLGDINVSVKEVLDLYGVVHDETMDAKVQRVSATPAWRRLVANCTSLASVVTDMNQSLVGLLGAMGHGVSVKPLQKKRRRTVVKKKPACVDMELFAANLEQSMTDDIIDSE